MTTPAVSVTVFNPPEEKKSKKAGGSLMVPREQYAIGSLIKKGLERATKKVYGILRKKDNLIKGGEYEDAIDEIDSDLVELANDSTSEEIDEIFSILEIDVTDRLPTDIIDKQNMGLLAPGEGSQIVEQEIKTQYPDFYEMFKGKGLFGDDDLNETNKARLERDKKILQKREYYSSFEDDDLEDFDPDNTREPKADGSLIVPPEGGQIFVPDRKGSQTSYDEDALSKQKATPKQDWARAQKVREDNEKLQKQLDAAAKKHAKRNLAEGGMPEEQDMPVDTYPNIPPEEMAAAEASQLPDNEMEDQYIDFILDESLNPEEQTYLMNSLEADPQLSVIFDKLIGTASEFSGAGEVEGPGTGVSDSIPARLSDGEFVMTRKATDAIGADNLQTMMDDAERAYDGGYMMQMAFGGVVEDEELEDSKSTNYQSKTDEEIRKVMIGSNRMPSVR